MLADFGFTRITTISAKVSSKEKGTMSFMAPELLYSEKFGLDKAAPSKEADVYALGMTVYQVLTGKWPFHPRREMEIIHVVISGERPSKPENAEEIGMTDVIWDLLGECWREDRTKRPTISEILDRFRDITGERKSGDFAAEAGEPRLDSSGNSAVPESSLFATVLALRGSDMGEDSPTSIVTVPSSPYEHFSPEEVSEAKGKGKTPDENTRKNQAAARIDHIVQRMHTRGRWGSIWNPVKWFGR